MSKNYLDLLAYFGIGGAHPGGFPLTKLIFQDEIIPQTNSVLEVGCGTGQTAAFIAQKNGCQVTAIDNHPIMLEKARERFKDQKLRINVIEGDVQKLPFEDNTFDLILAESVISFTDISKSLHELFRLLKSDGRLIMIEMTAEESLSRKMEKQVFNLYGIKEVLSEEEWKRRLFQIGFTDIEVIHTPSELIQTDISFDINPSENFSHELYDLWENHNAFIQQPSIPLGYRAFRCGFA